MKSSKLSQSSATLGICSLQEVAASWLQSHAANAHGASSGNRPYLESAIFEMCMISIFILVSLERK